MTMRIGGKRNEHAILPSAARTSAIACSRIERGSSRDVRKKERKITRDACPGDGSGRCVRSVQVLAAGFVGAAPTIFVRIFVMGVSRLLARVSRGDRRGQIGYALAPLIARGAMLGPQQPVILHLLDIPPAAQALEGVKMELIDAAFPLLDGVLATTDLEEACKEVDIAVMVGGFPRKEGMERKDVMSKNVSIYKGQAGALEKFASKNVKVVVVANPANTNALILSEHAPSIPRENITCLTRLDHNRALGQISLKCGVPVQDVHNCIIWGNHSSSQYPDVNHAYVIKDGKKHSVKELLADNEYLSKEFIEIVQQRGAAVIKARKASSALSAASSVCDHMRDWILGTPHGEFVSMGVISDGSYGVESGLMFSFPVTCKNGSWSVVQGLKIDAFSQEKLHITEKELIEEKQMAKECLT